MCVVQMNPSVRISYDDAARGRVWKLFESQREKEGKNCVHCK